MTGRLREQGRGQGSKKVQAGSTTWMEKVSYQEALLCLMCVGGEGVARQLGLCLWRKGECVCVRVPPVQSGNPQSPW